MKKVYIVCGVVVGISLLWVSIRPSHEREWSLDQAVLPYAVFDGEEVRVHNIRNFIYASTTSYTPQYYDKTFDLNAIRTVDYVVEPFSDFAGSAHTFLTFGFEGGDYLAISIEIRKEVGESFSAWKGLWKQYELMYVVADERDVIKLRSNYRNDLVYVYPIAVPPEKVRSLFVEMLTAVNEIKEKPRFYNTLFDTCTTNIVKHVNSIAPKAIPWSFKVLLPGYSDQLVYDLGLIDTDLSFEEARARYLINERAAKYADSPDFSQKIREN